MSRIAQCSISPIRRLQSSGKKRAGQPQLSSLLFSGLLPVAFDQNPAVAAMLPVMCDPDTAAMRRTYPMAVNPDVAVAVPTVVAVDPHPSLMRRMVVDLVDQAGALTGFRRETAVRRRSNHSLTVVAPIASLTTRDFGSEPRPLGCGFTRGDRVSRQGTNSLAPRCWPAPGRLPAPVG